jgi:signal transduction histidine kinase
LINMKRRLEDIGGICLIESSPNTGTTVQFRLLVRLSDEDSSQVNPPILRQSANGVHSRQYN